MKLSDFKYPLPRNLVAKYPANPRDSSRLMVVNRLGREHTSLKRFSEISPVLEEG